MLEIVKQTQANLRDWLAQSMGLGENLAASVVAV